MSNYKLTHLKIKITLVFTNVTPMNLKSKEISLIAIGQNHVYTSLMKIKIITTFFGE